MKIADTERQSLNELIKIQLPHKIDLLAQRAFISGYVTSWIKYADTKTERRRRLVHIQEEALARWREAGT
jgi:hypothetical protein